MISAKITNLKFVHLKKTMDDENNLIFQGKLLINGFKRPKRIHSEENYVVEINYTVNTEDGAVGSVNASTDDVSWTSDVDTESSISILGIPDVVYAHGPRPTLFLALTTK